MNLFGLLFTLVSGIFLIGYGWMLLFRTKKVLDFHDRHRGFSIFPEEERKEYRKSRLGKLHDLPEGIMAMLIGVVFVIVAISVMMK